MKSQRGFISLVVALLVAAPVLGQIRRPRPLGWETGFDLDRFRKGWRVLEPITRRNLSVYPVVSDLKVNTSGFITLDEGVASGEVRIAERGQVENTLYRRRESHPWFEEGRPRVDRGGASVNELVLINRSSRPLILLAGEVVSGGKQNRIIGADLVVPPKSDPLPLTVFCVEHGRWSASRGEFKSFPAIAHPGIRREAQVSKSQSGVWDSVARSAKALGTDSPTSDYATVLSSPPAKARVEDTAKSIESDYERELGERVGGRGAVGVVVAIDGELIWSDVFPSPELFAKYWPKLLRSYVLEAEGREHVKKSAPPARDATAFLFEDHGESTVREETGAFRRTEIASADYQIVLLDALGKYEGASLMLHYNKMARD